MRDLFQVVFELKKKEIEMAKHHSEQHHVKYGSTGCMDSIHFSKVHFLSSSHLLWENIKLINRSRGCLIFNKALNGLLKKKEKKNSLIKTHLSFFFF